jgi:hypothetical protein
MMFFPQGVGADFVFQTQGSEEIQMRKVAGYLFGFTGPKKEVVPSKL